MDDEDEAPEIWIVLRLKRPLQPDLPPVEASCVNGIWLCEDEYVRTWLEAEEGWIRATAGYQPSYTWLVALSAVKSLDAEIVVDNIDEEDAVDKEGRPVIY